MRLDNQEKYEILIDGKYVFAILHAPKDVALHDAESIFTKASYSNIIPDGFIYEKQFDVKGVYVGVAKCHEEDKFNYEHGVKLAKLRALKKYVKDRKRVAERIQRIAEDFAKRMKASADYFDFTFGYLDEEIESMKN